LSSRIHEEVTGKIVAELEQGVAPWVKPWKSGSAGPCLPVNAATRRAYRGVNILTLWGAAAAGGYPLPRWLTFRQARELGGFIRKGERATPIVLVKQMTVGESGDAAEEAGEDGTRQVTFLRYFWVFNVAQADGLPASLRAVPEPEPEGERHGRAEAFLAALGAEVRHGGDRACYVPSLDVVMLPPFAAFEGPGHYYATSLHEHAHWSGHPSRLDRDLSGRFGSRAYAAEELIAELTAAFLCAELGIEGRLRHAEYIGSWLELLRTDAKAVFTAASQASRAADWLRSFSEAPAPPAP
jgi:antirestriction protein ArdC